MKGLAPHGDVMTVIGILASLALIFFVLLDAFEVVVLSRRVNRPLRLAKWFYRGTWLPWRGLARRLRPGRRREYFLGLFGPLSILVLFALWVVGLIVGFGLLHLSLRTPLASGPADFATYLYLSGETFFTLGYGDATALNPLGRFLSVFEAGLGFGFLALVISYLPVLYQAFTSREITISLLDARAGSPPCAGQLLVRAARAGSLGALEPLLREWERWSAELLSSHLSFPMLAFYRSQHDNQSWLAALATILDASALLLVSGKGADGFQAQLTFAVARHAAVDLVLLFNTPPRPPDADRLPAERLAELRAVLAKAGCVAREGPDADAKLARLRGTYEPFLVALADQFVFTLPPVFPETAGVDNWQTSAWMRRTAGLGELAASGGDDHFD
jgi:hypothetical protein